MLRGVLLVLEDCYDFEAGREEYLEHLEIDHDGLLILRRHLHQHLPVKELIFQGEEPSVLQVLEVAHRHDLLD